MTSRSKLSVAAAVVAVAAGLTGLALTQTDPSAFAFKWYWSNNGVGNYVADLTAIAIGGWKLVKEWRAHRAHQARLEAHLVNLHEKHDRILDHLGIALKEPD